MKAKGQKMFKSFLFNNAEYKAINDKISSSFQDYLILMNEYSYELNLFSINKSFNFRKFIEDQQSLIKSLIKIINELSEVISYSNVKKAKRKPSIKEIILNNNIGYTNIFKNNSNKINSNIIIPKNNININNVIITKDNKKEFRIEQDDYINNEDLSFLNFKNEDKKNKRNNQSSRASEENDYNNIKYDISKSSITTNNFSTKNRSYINYSNSNISINEINSSNYHNNYLRKMNVSRFISSHHNKKNKINLKKSHKSNKSCQNNSVELDINAFSSNRKQKNKNRRSSINKSYDNRGDKTHNSNVKQKYTTSNYNKKTRESISSPKVVFDYSINKKYIPSSIFTESKYKNCLLNKGKYMNFGYVSNDDKINNEAIFDNFPDFTIAPNKVTKEMLRLSHSKLNKFVEKKKNTSLRKKSKSLLI